MPKFEPGDLVMDRLVPEAGFPLPDDRPMLILSIVEERWQSSTVIYSVITPGGFMSSRFESELITYPHGSDDDV